MKRRWRRRSRWKVDSPADCVARRVAFFSVSSSWGPAPAPSSALSSTGSAPAPSSAPSSWGSAPAPSSAPMAWPAPARAHSRCRRLARARRRRARTLKFAPAPSPTYRNAVAPPAMARRAGQSSRRSQLRASMHRLQSKVRPRVDAAGRRLPPSHRRMARPRHRAQHRPGAGNRQIPSLREQTNGRQRHHRCPYATL